MKKKLYKKNIIPFLLVLPSIFLVGIFVYGFIINTIVMSLHEWKGAGSLAFNPVKHFIGLGNYKELFLGIIQIRFRQEFINSIFYTVFLLAGTNIIGLMLAILFDRNLRFGGFFKTVFLYPLALSFIVSGTIWRWLLAPNTGVNTLPTFLGLSPFGFKWTSSRDSIINFNWQNIIQVFFAVLAFVLIILIYNRIRKHLYLKTRLSDAVTRTGTIVFFIAVILFFDWLTFVYVLYGFAALLFIGYFVNTVIVQKKRPEPRFVVLTCMFFLALLYVFVLHDSMPPVFDYKEQHGFNLATIGIIIAGVWQYSGYTMALYLAGLQSLPNSIKESAKIDGAGELLYYWKIAIPNLKPITLSAIIILAHISLKMFDLIFAMAGPDNINTSHPSINMYLTSFSSNNFGLGASIAMVMFILSAFLIIPYLIYSYKKK